MLIVRSFSLAFFLSYALLLLTFLHDKSQSNIYFFNVFRNSPNALLRIFSIEFHFIYSSYLVLLVCLGESFRGPHVVTLFIRFYYISDDGYFSSMVCSNIVPCMQFNPKFCFHISSFALKLALLWKCFYLFIDTDIHFYYSNMSREYWTKPWTNSFSFCHWNLNIIRIISQELEFWISYEESLPVRVINMLILKKPWCYKCVSKIKRWRYLLFS